VWVRVVDFERATLFVRSGKWAKGLSSGFATLELVRPTFVGERLTDHLFVSSRGTTLCPDWLCRKVRGHFASAGIDKLGAVT